MFECGAKDESVEAPGLRQIPKRVKADLDHSVGHFHEVKLSRLYQPTRRPGSYRRMPVSPCGSRTLHLFLCGQGRGIKLRKESARCKDLIGSSQHLIRPPTIEIEKVISLLAGSGRANAKTHRNSQIFMTSCFLIL